MVSLSKLRRFRDEEDGLSLVEGLITIPVSILLIAAMVEFSFAVWQWNQTVKAIQLGARLAAVSDPLATDYFTVLEDYGNGPLEGDPIPVGTDGAGNPDFSTTSKFVTCGAAAGLTACDPVELDRLVFGSDGVCNPNFGTTKPGVCDFNPLIEPENLQISYHRNWLGYVGRPMGPVSTITLEVRDLTFQLPFLGAMLGVNSVQIPAHPVTVTSEDMDRCPGSGSC